MIALAIFLIAYDACGIIAYWYATGKGVSINPSFGGAVLTTIVNLMFIFYIAATL